MPSLELNLSKKITKEQKKVLADFLSANVVMISGKTQDALMTVIRDDCYLQMGDAELENGAFINMNSFGPADPAEVEAYVKKIYEILEEELGMSPHDMYMNYTERSWWGCHGGVFTI